MKGVRGGAGITSSSSAGKYVGDAVMDMNMSMGMLRLETFPSRSEYPCISQGSPKTENQYMCVCMCVCVYIERGQF